MRKFALLFLLTALLMAPQWCVAQLSVKFKTLRVNNITNNLTTPAMTSLPFDALVLSDVGLAIDVELVNDGDSAVNLYAETATIGLLYYDSPYGWRKIDRLDDRDCRIPLQSGLVYLQHPNIKAHTSVTIQRFWYYRLPTFYDISSLYYVSSTVPTMRLVLMVPGQEPILSDIPETVYVNGLKLDDDWQECGKCASYQLLSNGLLKDYMHENPYLFGTEFSQDLIRKEFQCNMAFAWKQYSLLVPPTKELGLSVRCLRD